MKEIKKLTVLEIENLRAEIWKSHYPNNSGKYADLEKKTILFDDDYLFDILDWKTSVEGYKNNLLKKFEKGLKSNRKRIFDAEWDSLHNRSKPEFFFFFESIVSSFSENGENKRIGSLRISHHYLFDSESPFFIFPRFEYSNGESKIRYYNVKLQTLADIASGMTRPHEKEILLQMRNEFYPNITSEESHHENQKIESSLEWTDSKSDLVELITALWKSKRIKENGKPIAQNKLISLFENWLNVDLKHFHKLSKASSESYKKTKDSEYFLKELLNLVKDK